MYMMYVHMCVGGRVYGGNGIVATTYIGNDRSITQMYQLIIK